MIKLWVIKEGNSIVSWSTKQMSEDEIEIEMTEEEYKALLNSINDDPLPSVQLN